MSRNLKLQYHNKIVAGVGGIRCSCCRNIRPYRRAKIECRRIVRTLLKRETKREIVSEMEES